MLTCFTLLIFTSNIFAGSEVEMLTKSRVFVANVGSILNLQCSFSCSNFNFFDNPIFWRKTQLDEHSQINMMGNLMEPFESSGRFKVTFGHQSTSFILELFISHVVAEDSGNYTCEVKGPHNKLLNYVTHFIFVRAAVEVINLSLMSSDIDQNIDEGNYRSQLIFIENVSTTVSCRVTGGYPPPDLTIHIDQSDVTDEFHLQHKLILSGTKSLRRLIFTSWRRKVRVKMRRFDDGRNITCAATVPGLRPNSTSAIAAVYYAPSIRCDETFASLGDRNVHLRCIITSKPPTQHLFWVIDDANDTKLSEGDFIGGHWTQIIIQSDGSMESKLYILKIRSENFRSYKIVASNIIGNHSEEVVLTQKKHSKAHKNGEELSKTKFLRDQAPFENVLRMTLRSDTRGVKNICMILVVGVVAIIT